MKSKIFHIFDLFNQGFDDQIRASRDKTTEQYDEKPLNNKNQAPTSFYPYPSDRREDKGHVLLKSGFSLFCLSMKRA
uniref:Uncharacterized protein n=1 Tax=Parietochloris pseudoalveolaris TaxID=3102 RepID=A0A097KLK6_9CHLO|nr:hypothetical protein [Parietochloris pseudoalveolaris]AIT94069.1 hypothetical protein [Parietochloris pseudoalveolaris]